MLDLLHLLIELNLLLNSEKEGFMLRFGRIMNQYNIDFVKLEINDYSRKRFFRNIPLHSFRKELLA